MRLLSTMPHRQNRPMSLARFFSPRGTIDRLPYLLLGLVLVGAKLAIDATLCRLVFHRPWQIADYLWPQFSLLRLTGNGPLFFVLTMLTIAAPFAWVGVCLTTQRLRAVRAPIWLVILFFVPFLKFLLFALLALLPSRPTPSPRAPVGSALAAPSVDWMPESPLGSAVLAIIISGFVGSFFAALSIYWQQEYLNGLFVGLPFALGFLSALLYEARCPRRLSQSIGVAVLAIFLVGLLIIAVAIEGLVCVAMAAPLALCEAVVGAVVAHAFYEAMRHRRSQSFLSVVALLSLLMWRERSAPLPLHSVTSEVVVNLPPERVWPHVIGFSTIPPPRDWIFRAGIAYPIRAEIEGRGVGATRHCVFSTGAFIEPITTWEEPTRLAFSVSAQPAPLRELSPYQGLRSAHLDGYFKSERGEFRLLALPGGRTLLRGTTWYSDRIEPQIYWGLWSDRLIHRIHERVLDHIRREAESALGAP